MMLKIEKPVIVLGLCALVMLPVQAEIYKWVDADGKVHYSEKKPVDSVKLDTIKPPPKVDTDQARQNLDQKQRDFRERKIFERNVQLEKNRDAEDQARAKASCENAKAKVRSMQRPRVNVVDEQGNRVRIGEDERQKQLSEANKAVKKHCK